MRILQLKYFTSLPLKIVPYNSRIPGFQTQFGGANQRPGNFRPGGNFADVPVGKDYHYV